MQNMISIAWMLAAVIRPSAQLPEFVNIALGKVGSQYKYATAGPDTFDCSGLVYFSLEKVGVKPPRCSKDFAAYGVEAQKDHLQAGDLLLFATNSSAPKTINHIGIYLGDHEMVAASSSKGKVLVQDTNAAYWQKCFISARRLPDLALEATSRPESTDEDLNYPVTDPASDARPPR